MKNGENTCQKKEIGAEPFVFLLGFLAFFALFISRMGVSNTLNTMMNTAYRLLMDTAFYIMALAVITGYEQDGAFHAFATVDGVDYYYRVTNSTFSESVTDTIPYSFYVTSDPDEKGIKEFTLEELGAGFYMGYPSGDNIHKIYATDVDKDDLVDTGLNSGLDVARHCFFWDGTNQQIFAMRGDSKYVLVVKTLRNIKSGAEELHMQAVPAAELEGDDPAYPVRFVTKHVCVFSQELTANEHSHWYGCDCGEKKDLQLHQVEDWTVTQEPAAGVEGSRTGKCTVCGETATESIPALKDKTAATQPEEEAEETPAAPVNPGLIVAAAALAVLGVVLLIFGNRKKKQ